MASLTWLQGWTPLHLTELVQAFKRKTPENAIRSYDQDAGLTDVKFEFEEGRCEVVRLLLEQGASIPADSSKVCCMHCSTSHLRVLVLWFHRACFAVGAHGRTTESKDLLICEMYCSYSTVTPRKKIWGLVSLYLYSNVISNLVCSCVTSLLCSLPYSATSGVPLQHCYCIVCTPNTA